MADQQGYHKLLRYTSASQTHQASTVLSSRWLLPVASTKGRITVPHQRRSFPPWSLLTPTPNSTPRCPRTHTPTRGANEERSMGAPVWYSFVPTVRERSVCGLAVRQYSWPRDAVRRSTVFGGRHPCTVHVDEGHGAGARRPLAVLCGSWEVPGRWHPAASQGKASACSEVQSA
jgi:hypothetical protein